MFTNLKRKRKRSLAHANTDQKKTEKNSIQEKRVSNTEILEKLKTVLNQRKHFDHNEHDPFHDSIKDGPLYICSLTTLCRE